MNIDIETIKRKIIVKFPFFASVIAHLNFIESPNCYSNGVPTAGTDGKNVYYHTDIFKNLTLDELIFIFTHEVCHVAFNHIQRSEGKDSEVWNLATDAVINAQLQKEGIKLVKGGVDIPDAIHYDAEEMYQKLLDEKNIEEQKNNQGKNGQSKNEEAGNTKESQNKDVGHDTHGMWKDAIKKEKEQEKQQEETSNDQEKEQKDLENQRKNKQQIKKMAELGEKEIFKQNRIERKKQLEELKEALAKQSISWGNTTNSEIRKITDVGITEPLIDWRLLLKEAVSYNIDWSYQNASIEDGVVTPHLEDFPTPETEILLDTSGSIDETLLRNFLKECKNILQSSRVKVGCFDTRFYGFQEIKAIHDIDNLNLMGGGGTDFNVAVSSFTKRVENKIIFTDGEAPMPNETMNVIWIVFGGKQIQPRGGKVIQISEEQLRRLQCLNEDTIGKHR